MPAIIDVLECTSGTAKSSGNAYNILLIRYPSGSGRIGKIFSDVKIDPDTDVEVDFDFSPNRDMFMSVKVKSLHK